MKIDLKKIGTNKAEIKAMLDANKDSIKHDAKTIEQALKKKHRTAQ